MQTTSLNSSPISWLMERSNPSVRYWTLVDVLRQPTDAPDAIQTREEISKQPIVLQIFKLQQPGGYWGEDETKPYTAKGAVGVLNLLYSLGVSPDERTTSGCDSFLRYSQNENGGFSMVKTRRSAVFPCTTGEHLGFLVYFGLGDDPRVRKAFHFLLERMSSEDALICGRYEHRDCLWGAIASLKGLAVLPNDLRNSRSQLVIERLANSLLEAPYDFNGEHKRWFTFGVPRAWDLISALYVLVLHGYESHPQFNKLLELVLQKQDEEGRWICSSVSRTWPLEKRNQPSKWVTLDVLRTLKTIGYTFTTGA